MPVATVPELSAAFLPALLDLLPSGVVCYTPQYDAAGAVVDLHFAYLNPAAQRMLGLPAQPTASYAEQFPTSRTNGGLAFHLNTYLSDAPGHFELNYQADGYDNYFLVDARRVGEALLVTFTDTATQSRTAVEVALRESQAREQQARAEAETALSQAQEQHELTAQALGQVPAAVATLSGPEHRFAYLNDQYLALTAGRAAVGQTVAELLPEIVGQGFIGLLNGVYTTGQPYVGKETPIQLHDAATGQPAQRYLDFLYQPLVSDQGQVQGILVFAVDVTEKVWARQQVQELNEELAAINEELRVSNEEYLLTNFELVESQQQLHVLNQELAAFNQDLEARVVARAQEARQQRGQLERLVLAAPVAICVFNGPDWVYQVVNPRYQQMFPGRQLLGLRLVDALPELADQPLMDILRHVYDTGVTFESREVLVPLARTADGPVEDIYFDLTYQARYNEVGQIDGFITFAADVTEQVLARRQVQHLNDELTAANEALEARVLARTQEVQQAQQAAEHQRALLQRVLEQAPVAIAIMEEPAHILTFANARMAEIWGRPLAQVLGQPHFAALPDTAGQGLEAVFTGVFTSGEPVVMPQQLTYLDRAGTGQPTPHYLHMVFEPLRDEQGRITGLIASATDITEMVVAHHQVEAQQRHTHTLNEEMRANNAILERTQAQLRELNEELEDRVQRRTQELSTTNRQLRRTNADLDNFIYTASHDLKAPISNIEGLLLLLGELLPEPVRTDAEVAPVLSLMQGAVERFIRTIGHLTDVTKLQLEFAQPAVPVLLASIVEDVRQDLLPLLTKAGAVLEVDVNDCRPRVFSEKNLRSIIYNLLSNAVKYRAPGRPPRVRLACRIEGDTMLLTVQDNGLGLDAQQQTRLFQLFQRLHTHVEGTGLGLYMVKSIVENAGGNLAVQSQVNVGTTFILTFPA